MWITFRALLAGALRDKISLFYGLGFPLVLLGVLGYFFPDPAYRQLLLVGMTALGGFFFTLTGTGFEVMKQRSRGVYKLLRATPFRTATFVAALTAARGVVSLITTLLVLALGALYLGLSLSLKGVLLMLPALVLGTICFTALGFILGNLGANETQVAGFNNLFTFPMIFGSQIFYSLDAAPQFIKLLSKALPMEYYLTALRSALAGDPGAMLQPMLALAGFTVLILMLAVATFRWDPDGAILQVRRA